ncbi:MAG: universal stress protein [Chloroflexota bacterium]
MFDRIVVALDGSETAESALPRARELATALSAPLHLVRVVDLGRLEQYGALGLALDASALDLALEDERRAVRDYLAATQARLAAEGLAVTTESREGLAARELAAAAAPGDLLVMASHGRTGLRRWFLGSVAEEVVRHAPGPVLLVRAETS